MPADEKIKIEIQDLTMAYGSFVVMRDINTKIRAGEVFVIMLQEMVKTLDPREATILRARFGLDGGAQKTLEEVGQKFGVTRERVRQIQNIALTKLRRMIEKLEAVQK